MFRPAVAPRAGTTKPMTPSEDSTTPVAAVKRRRAPAARPGQGAPPRSSAKTSESASGGARRRDGAGRRLVVVESPAKAKTINRYLGGGYVVKASMGHVRDLPSKTMGVDVEHDFAPTYEPLAGRKKVLSELKKYAASAPEVFLATDLDREGEAIAWHLAEALRLPPEKVRRVIFNEITAGAIREAFASPRAIDMNKVNAQQARRILDRLVGYEISPLLWRKVAAGLSAGRVQSVAVRLIVERERQIEAFAPEEYWRFGAVFTTDCAAAESLRRVWEEFLARRDEKGNPPTVSQEQDFLRELKALRAELVQWKGAKFQASNESVALEAARAIGAQVVRLDREEDARGKGVAAHRVTVVAAPAAGRPKFYVRGLSQRDSTTRPYAPFTTVTLQQAASVQLRFSASRTMRIAQQLYEGVEVPGSGSVGLITYMRTDSTQLSKEAVEQVRSMIGRQFGGEYLPEKPLVYASGQRAQEAHEAVRPTDVSRSPDSLIGALTDEQQKLYELVWKRFVACQMASARWKVTEADIVAATPAGEAVFKAMGRQLVFDGFLRVAGLPRGGDQTLPELRAKQELQPLELAPTQHFTQPPPRYTEASLVKALEADGIGRPSTYAAIIQTIQDRSYAEMMDRSFRPTHLGVVVTDKLVKHFPAIFDIRFTAQMEDDLDRVEEADLDWVAALREFYGPFKQDLDRAREEMVHAKAESQPSEYSCEACGKPMVYRFNKTGRYLACTGYPECKTTAPVDAEGKKLLRKEVDTPCPQCGKKMMLRQSRFGPFLGCSDYPKCKGIVPCDKEGNPLKVLKPEEVRETCSACGAPMAVRFKGRRPFLGCSKYPECKNAAPLPEGIRIQAPPRPPPKEAGANCPKCGRPMVIRDGKRGEFIACSGFPRCRNAMNLDKLDELKAQQAATAPAAKTPSRKK
jgi:DNA topoisomerase I